MRPAAKSSAHTAFGNEKWAMRSPWRWPIWRRPTVNACSPRLPGPAATPGQELTSSVIRRFASCARVMTASSRARRPISIGNSWRLSSVERASMTEQVLRELREAIIEGRIPQGEPLREVSLAGTLGTGRSAVREAIRQLVQEGLVDYEPHRGAMVRVMSLADRLDVYVAREAIEVGATRRILAAPPADLSDLRAALEELRG